ncbi:MAG: type II toxin-antitoxin system RelE family toxin [Nitrososphaera sp.]
MAARWQIRETDQVLRQFKKLGDLQKKQYREAIKTLASSGDPRKLGTFKRGKKYSAYYYELGRSFRLVYLVINEEMLILLLDLGDHKQVYGKD